jgi:hypothetical protein
MKFVFKWLLRLFLLGVVLLAVFLLSLDTILRVMVEHNIRAQTGMDAEIGKFHLGLLEPVVQIKDLKLYNPPNFGGTPFLSIPEIYVEYDKPALAKSEIHVTLMRFNLGELDIVKNAAGKTNLFELGITLPSKASLTNSADIAEFKKKTGLTFKSIDALNVSVGKLKYIDLGDQKNNREQDVDIENQVIPHVKTPADLAGLVVLVALRSGDFFNTLAAPVSLK